MGKFIPTGNKCAGSQFEHVEEFFEESDDKSDDRENDDCGDDCHDQIYDRGDQCDDAIKDRADGGVEVKGCGGCCPNSDNGCSYCGTCCEDLKLAGFDPFHK